VVASCRPGTAIVAALLCVAAVMVALRSLAREAAPTSTVGPDTPWLGLRVRSWFRGLLAPYEAWLARTGVSPDAVTWAQLVTSALGAWAFGTGCVFLAGWLTVLAGILDIVDGGLARRSGVAGPRGALVDSVVDRCSEFVTFVGLGILFRDVWTCFAVVVAAFASFMVSYTRARAEGLGVDMGVGRAQRPERYVLLGFGAWISDICAHVGCALGGGGRQVVLEATLVVLAAIAASTAVGRLRHAVRVLRTGSGA
jgi:CDP-diacylglycerol--glycerol-3-phosphate 3-phosphatidyltransferase